MIYLIIIFPYRSKVRYCKNHNFPEDLSGEMLNGSVANLLEIFPLSKMFLCGMIILSTIWALQKMKKI